MPDQQHAPTSTDEPTKPHAFPLIFTTPGGIPMTLAGKLMATLGDWFPNSTVADPQGGTFAINIPWDDYHEWLQHTLDGEAD